MTRNHVAIAAGRAQGLRRLVRHTHATPARMQAVPTEPARSLAEAVSRSPESPPAPVPFVERRRGPRGALSGVLSVTRVAWRILSGGGARSD